MELVLKNISAQDLNLIADLASRLGIEVEEKRDTPDQTDIIYDLKDAIEEIKMADKGKLKLQEI